MDYNHFAKTLVNEVSSGISCKTESRAGISTLKLNPMKISKSVLQAVAIAVVVTTVTSCAVTSVDPEKERITKTKKTTPSYSCPACGMG
jgi:hypothetical protein